MLIKLRTANALATQLRTLEQNPAAHAQVLVHIASQAGMAAPLHAAWDGLLRAGVHVIRKITTTETSCATGVGADDRRIVAAGEMAGQRASRNLGGAMWTFHAKSIEEIANNSCGRPYF